MKKSLCILLALFLLLTACKAVPDKDANGKGESISFQTASPWSRLKSLSAELMADNDFASSSPIFAMNSLEGTLGTTSYYVNTLEESMGNSQESTVSCTVRATEELQMIEYTQQMMGAEIPIIAWQVGEEGYAQLPTLYPDSVFFAQSVPEFSGPISLEGDPSVSLSEQFDSLLDAFQEHASPETAMTAKTKNRVTTFCLTMDEQQTAALAEAWDAIMGDSIFSDMFLVPDGVLDDLSTLGRVPEETYTANPSALTVTTDAKTYIHYLFESLSGGTAIKTLALNYRLEEDSASYTLTYNDRGATVFTFTAALSEQKVSLTGEIPLQGAALKLRLDILAESETSAKLDGELTVSLQQGGFSMAVPVALEGSLRTEANKTELVFSARMDVMGEVMEAEVGVTFDSTPVTLELPFDPALAVELDSDDFQQKLEDLYGDMYEDTGRSFSAADPLLLIVTLEGRNAGHLTCEGTYREDGESLQVSYLDSLQLTGTLQETDDPNVYLWNSQELYLGESNGVRIFGYTESDSWSWQLVLRDDGTCFIESSFRRDEEKYLLCFANGTELSADTLEIIDITTIRFCGRELLDSEDAGFQEEDLYCADNTDSRLSVSSVGEYRYVRTSAYTLEDGLLTVDRFGEYRLTYADGDYFLNGTLCTLLEDGDTTYIACQRNGQRLLLNLLSDGTCQVTLQGWAGYDTGSYTLTVSFREGDDFSIKMHFNMDETNVIIMGDVLNLIPGGSAEL